MSSLSGDQDTPFETNGEDRGDRIIAAAYYLLGESGLEGLTIRAVLQYTGLSRRAFYDRFAGKDDLVLAVFSRTLQLAADLFAADVATIADPLDRLQYIVEGIVLGKPNSRDATLSGGDRASAALSREHLRLAEARPAELQAAIRPLITLIAQQLADGMASGQVRSAPVERLATLIYNLVATTIHAELLAEQSELSDPERRRKLASEIWEFCSGAIRA